MGAGEHHDGKDDGEGMSGTEEEVWRPVLGYEGSYEVSSLGRVRSVDRPVEVGNRWGTRNKRWLKGRILRLSVLSGKNGRIGALFIILHPADQEKGSSHRFVHHLVLEAFVGPRPDGRDCAHYDGDPTNNRIENLRWATKAENENDKRRHGTTVLGVNQKNAKLKDRDVILIRWLRAHQGWTINRISKFFCISTTTAQKVSTGRAWEHVQ